MFTFSAKACHIRLWTICLVLCHPLSAQIIISQYYEGIANDKFLEITNVSGSVINQTNGNFFICVFSNEDAGDPLGKKPGLSTRIEVDLSPGETVIYKNSLAGNPEYAVNEGLGALIGAFNGNDVLIISTSKDITAWENRIDVIGNSSDWGIDRSFYRKTAINNPNPVYSPDEWVEVTLPMVNGASENTVERLGYHIYNCEKPSAASSNLSFLNISDTSFDIHWNSGNGSSRLVVVKAGEAISISPVDGTIYYANAEFGSGDPFDGGFVVYNGWENSFSLTNLAPSTQYFVSVFEFDCSPPLYLTGTFSTGSQTTLVPIPRIFINLDEQGLDFGLVYPNNSSPTSEIIVSWANLSSDITANVDSPFEISLDGSDWLDQISIPTFEGDNKTVYVRFSPKTADGIHHAAITFRASGAADVSPPLKGTAFPNAWINEFHYEDIGADEGEFVEVVLQYYGNYDLSALKLQLYNGSSGLVYDQESLDNFIPGERANNFRVYLWPVTDIQNGNPGGPDGLALGIGGRLIHFLSYEGVFTAVNGIATGSSSIDIGLEESDQTTLEGFSLQLADNELIEGNIQVLGNQYEDFVWIDGLESPGLFNSNQALPVELGYFNAIQKNNVAVLSWQTLSEVNNHGFEIQKSVYEDRFQTISFIEGHGTTSQPVTYNYTDPNFWSSCYYRLKQLDSDGQFSFSRIISLRRSGSDPAQFLITPNPVRQKLDIVNLTGAKTLWIDAQLSSIHGKKILQTKGDLVNIKNQINGRLKYLQKGIYLLTLQNGWQSEKHILLKE